VLADPRFIGFPAPRPSLEAVSILETRLRPANRPLSLTSGSSSLEAMPLQSSFDVNRRSLTFRCEQPTKGSGPPRDITTAQSLNPMRPLGSVRPPTRNFPSPATVRPQAFTASRRFHPRYGS
jgi:hypothetical protein